VTSRAKGVIRLLYSYVDPDGSPNVHEARARIQDNGDWALEGDQVPAQLAQCGGYLSIQFTGYFERRIRGEQLAYELNAGQTRLFSCSPVMNPYPGTRYEGVDLTRIRATGLSCDSARQVARGAHRKALGLSVPSSGVRRFSWNGWSVTGDLRYSSDRYVATRDGKRVSWRF
jgi:hypothetical protein